MSVRPYRTHLGEHFSEGSRLLWARLQKTSRAEMATKLGCSKAQLLRVLYGDRRAGLAFANKASEEYGIATTSWARQPSRAFVLPAAA